ncbi:hypothetical protein N7493_008730 [Penicillium malachiteum]|uniref:Uncharacterized protein n=1 Tax=Penicillium malachiteum TaxID=1324776 RepID=A0AAD6MSY0_9EURO|nr:hypothetical protein N7493_008730 [Penicillium malachiteum]
MRASWWIGICAICLPTSINALEITSFVPAQTVSPNKRAFEVLQLLKRNDNCPSGYNACTNEGNSAACCKSGTNCTKDSANQIACCPTGASCTGTLTGTATSTETTGSGFEFPQGATTTTTTTTSEDSGSGATSTVSGVYPFVYVPTSLSNAKTCSSYYSLCQSEYTGCTQALMGRWGVTVAGSDGGITVEAITATSEATSICSSLKSSACHGLSLGYCETLETATATATAQGNGAPQQGRSTSLHDLVLGLAVGVAGMFI